jgi:hypothetical protein
MVKAGDGIRSKILELRLDLHEMYSRLNVRQASGDTYYIYSGFMDWAMAHAGETKKSRSPQGAIEKLA